MFKDYLEATGGMRLSSNLLNIPMVTFLAKKDFSEIERRLELGFGILENNTWQKVMSNLIKQRFANYVF